MANKANCVRVVGSPWPCQLFSHSTTSTGWGGENKMKKCVDWDRDKEITYQLLPQAKQTELGEN